MMQHTQLLIVGAGPAGLTAALQASESNIDTVLVDENELPGGQLFKQIHKFFGSEEHGAGIRGIDLAQNLLDEVDEAGVDVRLSTTAWGFFPDRRAALEHGGEVTTLTADRVILATGARENPLTFPGWHLPGVLGAGAAQTLVNCHHVLPGRRVLMVGSGNVGLIVAYQLAQAGMQVAAVIEADTEVAGYGVHAAKLLRMGIPILTSHTVTAALGDEQVESAVISRVDSDWQPVDGTEKFADVDTVCLAVGMSPLSSLAAVAGCRLVYSPALGGFTPWHNQNMQTSQPWIYVAGDVAGIEEASAAAEEGRLAAISVAESLGHTTPEAARQSRQAPRKRLAQLRDGPFGEEIASAKDQLFADGKVVSEHVN